jgi:hypothetical protein
VYEKLRLQLREYPREKIIFASVVVLTILLALWIAEREPVKDGDANAEMSLNIPKGMLVVPLELANGNALSALVSHAAIVDVFQSGEKRALVENLRIIKLNAGEGPLFGALVPEKVAGGLQEIFSHPKLKAAIRTLNSGATLFHLNSPGKPLLSEVPVGEDN